MDARRTARVLRDMNAIRTERGLPTIAKIPKGFPSASQCPLARALDADVGAYDWWGGSIDHGPLSTVLIRFREDFDGGRLPEFDA